MRTVEKEVRYITRSHIFFCNELFICSDVEYRIRREYPAAQYIELEPLASRVESQAYAIDDSQDKILRDLEIETIQALEEEEKRNDTKK